MIGKPPWSDPAQDDAAPGSRGRSPLRVIALDGQVTARARLGISSARARFQGSASGRGEIKLPTGHPEGRMIVELHSSMIFLQRSDP